MDELIITESGALTPFGYGLEPQRDALRRGASAIAPSKVEPGAFTAELPESPKRVIKRKGLTALSRAAQVAAAAVESLLETSRPIAGDEVDDCALVVGTAHGHLASKARFHEEALEDGPALVSPLVFPNSIINSLAGHTAIVYGLRGPNSTVTSGRRSGLEALVRAQSLIHAARARRALVVAADEVSPALCRGLRAAGELCTNDPSGPRASQPYVGPSSGVYPGEGGVAVLVESAAEATRAGHAPLLRLRGAAESTSVGRPLEGAVEEALRGALERGGCRPEDVAWLALSGCGLERLDRAEAEGVRRVFASVEVPGVALKATFGETFGAAGLLAVLAVILSLEEGFVPATPGSTEDTGPGLSTSVRTARSGPVLVSAVDEGGAMAVLVER